ncbi:MAG: hypothetical protein DELT_02481 [Desulfovibrio sp.]
MTPISVIWVGNPFFMPALRDLAGGDFGWRVHHINPEPGVVLGWDDLVADAGFTPGIVIVADKSTPPFVTGMENFPCLTVFYAVDTHIHSWFPHYAQGFDICLVSLKDHIPLFGGGRLSGEAIWWSPPYANPLDVPRPFDPSQEAWDVLFVGTVDTAVNPDRCAFFEELGTLLPNLHITRGRPCELYPQAKIVLNHAIHNDLNFRVFEALGCGKCLVTPLVRHGFSDLFTNGEDLFTYDQNNVPALAALCQALLKTDARRESAASSGHAKVAAGHYMRHRAETFAARIMDLFVSGRAATMVAERRATAKTIHTKWLKLLYLHHAETAGSASTGASYLAASKK